MNLKLTRWPLLSLLAIFFAGPAFSQRSLKYENGGGPSGSGASTTDKTVTIYNGDAGVYSPTTTVTYSLSNQQYTSVEGNANIPGLVFGAAVNGNGNTPLTAPNYGLMNRLGGSGNTHYSTNGATPAINVTNDYTVSLMTIGDALINANGSNKIATNTKNVYFGDLTLTFNRPVNNPILHFTGMGGFYNGSNGALGFAAGFELTNSGYTLSRLAGNFAFSLVNNNKIYNSSAQFTTGTNNSSPSAASGSVLVNGSNITSLTFKVLMDGDRAGRNWSATNVVNGDEFLVAVTLTTYNISGNVLNDANGMSDNTVNGPGTNAGGLNAVLIDPATGNVVATVPVNADGTYNFTNILGADYSIAITKDNVTVGQAFPGVVLPDGWAATGENLGTGAGSDGTADGILTGVSVNGNITNANFGVQQTPVTDNKEQTIPTPTSGSIPQGSITTPVSGNDAEDGALDNGNTIVITELPSNGTMYYNGNPVTAGQQIGNFDPALLSFTDLQDGTNETSFKYSFLDAAGQQSQPPGTYTIKWDGYLPVTFGPVTAKFSNGQLLVNWSTEMERDNDHFEVQVSRDGTHFETIATVKSKAANGNSDRSINYELAHSMTSAMGLAGIPLILAALVAVSMRRKKQLLLPFIALYVLFGVTSCTKNGMNETKQDRTLFVKILQVDKSGNTRSSKIVKVVEE
ncbi:hypothetical protein [Niabella beijingensis]|uniref:hypothetical protein n=1 Tax=Niabella beijingensis TaxID=2872700 RepID=UPI001CC08EFE|nr:hypothetical protein [Niabella beijingensis]MBZ4192470.1 hypothetical protein [Niabella beijingensis]